jgi:hypothetical protein
MEPWRAVDAPNGGSKLGRGGSKMEAWRFCRPVAADSHHLDEEQDQDPH